MSCSLYRWAEYCEGQPCPGDCDLCNFDYTDNDAGEINQAAPNTPQ